MTVHKIILAIGHKLKRQGVKIDAKFFMRMVDFSRMLAGQRLDKSDCDREIDRWLNKCAD